MLTLSILSQFPLPLRGALADGAVLPASETLFQLPPLIADASEKLPVATTRSEEGHDGADAIVVGDKTDACAPAPEIPPPAPVPLPVVQLLVPPPPVRIDGLHAAEQEAPTPSLVPQFQPRDFTRAPVKSGSDRNRNDTADTGTVPASEARHPAAVFSAAVFDAALVSLPPETGSAPPNPAETIAIEIASALQSPQTRPGVQAAAPVAAQSPIVEPKAERFLDLARDDAWLETLSREIVGMRSHDRNVSFRLVPEMLGNLDVAVASVAGGLAIKLTADDVASHAIVAATQHRLVEQVRAQGVTVTELTVTTGSGQNASDRSPGFVPPPPERVETAPQDHEATQTEPKKPNRLYA